MVLSHARYPQNDQTINQSLISTREGQKLMVTNYVWSDYVMDKPCHPLWDNPHSSYTNNPHHVASQIMYILIEEIKIQTTEI